MNLSVLGCGYVGLVTGACFADLGNNISCYDISSKRVNSLKKSVVPFHEPGLDNLVAEKVENGQLAFTSSLKNCLEFSDVYFICVGTPQKHSGKPNLDFIDAAITSIFEYVTEQKNSAVKKHIFIKSTVPPGTVKSYLKKLKKALLNKQNLKIMTVTFSA